MLLLLVGGHYVDDFNGVEYAEHSDSAFHAFSEFFHVLGLRVKDSKAQPPASRHILQGVEVHVRQDSPTPQRVAKLRHVIDQALGSNCLRASSRSSLRLCSAQWGVPPYNQCTPDHTTPRRATTSPFLQDFAPPSTPWITS